VLATGQSSPTSFDDIGAVLSVLLIASFMWLVVTYLRGPHDLRRLFAMGERETAATAGPGKVFIGMCFVRVCYASLVGHSIDSDLLLDLLGVLGGALVVAGLAQAWRHARHRGDGSGEMPPAA
jgi:hypothetical protein